MKNTIKAIGSMFILFFVLSMLGTSLTVYQETNMLIVITNILLIKIILDKGE